MDLATIKKEIESGAIMSWLELKHKLMQMFANAVMYNSVTHSRYWPVFKGGNKESREGGKNGEIRKKKSRLLM